MLSLQNLAIKMPLALGGTFSPMGRLQPGVYWNAPLHPGSGWIDQICCLSAATQKAFTTVLAGCGLTFTSLVVKHPIFSFCLEVSTSPTSGSFVGIFFEFQTPANTKFHTLPNIILLPPLVAWWLHQISRWFTSKFISRFTQGFDTNGLGFMNEKSLLMVWLNSSLRVEPGHQEQWKYMKIPWLFGLWIIRLSSLWIIINCSFAIKVPSSCGSWSCKGLEV